jgi:FMN-dependent NADH-azoreductase
LLSSPARVAGTRTVRAARAPQRTEESTVTLFRLDASIFPETSASAEIADIVEAEWTAAHPGGRVVRRSLAADPLPSDAWVNAVVGSRAPEGERTAPQREALALARLLAAELQEADVAVLAVPLYNYGVSQHFKAWSDLVIEAFGPGNRVLEGKPAVLVTVRGGGYGAGTAREGWDHSTPYLERVLQDMWGADLTVVERELTLATVVPAMEPLRELAAELHGRALAHAHEVAKSIAAA